MQTILFRKQENKGKNEKTNLTYEERLKIEDMLRSRTKYTIQQIADMNINRKVRNDIKEDKWKATKDIRICDSR